MRYWLDLFSTGFIDPETKALGITSSEKSLIVSILSAGEFFGALFGAPMGDLVGRRIGMILSSFVFIFGVVLQTAATAIPLFTAGRFFAGLGVGLISMLVPLYQSETAPKWIRGTIVGTYQLAITIGLLLAAIVNNATKDRNDSGSYRIPVAVQFAWALIIIVGMIILPESPRYLIKRGHYEKAARSLSRLRRLETSHPALVAELAEVRANHEYELSLGSSSYTEIVKGTIGKRLLTGCMLQSLQQLSGVNFYFYYGTTFFQTAGVQNPFTTTLVTNIVNVVSTFPGLYLVEKWGRRPLLLFGAIGMTVCQLIVASIGTALPHEKVANKVLIAFVCFYIYFFASSWGPTPWVVTGELFPLKSRAKCLSITTASNWLFNWALAFSTPYMVDASHANMGPKVCFVWGGFCFLACFFVYFMIYETKGLTLEQVDELYSKTSKAWKSKAFVPTVSFAEVNEVAEKGRSKSLADLEADAVRKKSVVHADLQEKY